jgi:MFS family permease
MEAVKLMIQGLLSIRKLDRNVKLVLIANLCIGAAFIGVSSLILNLYLASLKFDSVFIGNLNGIGLLAFTLAALPAGMLGSRFGVRRVAVIGMFFTAFAKALFLFSVFLPESFWQVVMTITAALAFGGGAAGMVNMNTYLMQVASPQQRQPAFTFSATFMALGAMLGNLAGGFLPGLILNLGHGAVRDATAYGWVLWLVAAGYAGAGIALWLTAPAQQGSHEAPEEQHAGEPVRENGSVGVLLFLGMLFLIQIFSEASFSTFMTLFQSQDLFVPLAVIGSINAAYNPVIVLAAPLMLLLLKRFGAGRTLVHGAMVMTVCALLAAFFHLPAVVFPAAFFSSLIMNFNSAARNLFGQEAVAPRLRPFASAITSISWSLGSAIAALAGGRLIAGAGYSALFVVSAVAALVSILVYAIYEKVNARRAVAAAAVSQ